MTAVLLALAAMGAGVTPTPASTATPSLSILQGRPDAELMPWGGSLAQIAKKIRLKLPANVPRVINNETVKELAKGVELTMSAPTPGGEQGPKRAGGEAGKKVIWQERYRSALGRVQRLESEIKDLESRANQLENEFYAHDDPVYRDSVIKPAWDKALSDLSAARGQLVDARQEPDRVLDAARRDGALPGWFRGVSGEREPGATSPGGEGARSTATATPHTP